MDGRQQLEMIQTLLKNLVYVRSDSQIKSTLDQTTTYINSKNLAKYCEFQAAYKDRLAVLRTEKREVAKQEGADKNMPPILSMWSGSYKTTQPSQHFKHDLSCAFNDARMNEYEKHNTNFQNSLKLHGPHAAGKLIPLLTLDIAYIKSFDVEWEGMPGSLDTGGASDGDDDDDAAIDSSKWDPTDLSTYPDPSKLRIPNTGKIQQGLLVAAVLFTIPEKAAGIVQKRRGHLRRMFSGESWN